MKSLPTELRFEFERATDAIGDMEQLPPPCMNVSDVLEGYFILADYFSDASGGQAVESMTIGVRDNGHLLASAIGRQAVAYDGRVKYTKPLDICATLFYGLTKNHAFLDGNKRISLLTLLYQLNNCGYYPKESSEEFENLVLAVAASELPAQYPSVYEKHRKSEDAEVLAISDLLRVMTEKKNHSYHATITMRAFTDALEAAGVECSLEPNNKIRCSRKLLGNTKRHSLSFMGWTRPVGATTARECLTVLGLYDQYPSYESFMDQRSPFYSLISKYEMPFRRLKDS